MIGNYDRCNDERWLEVTDAFQAAAFDAELWPAALDGLAAATGSTGGELIVLGPQATMPLHIMTNVAPGLVEASEAGGVGDPERNPRVKAGMAVPDLTVLAEDDFITPDEYKRHPHYQEFAGPWGIPFICLAPLQRTADLLIGLAVVRAQREGHITRPQREVFASIAPHVRTAVRTQMALENQGPRLLAGALEALSIAAFVCDRNGIVRALTPSAEAVIGEGRSLQLKLGRLRAPLAGDTQSLNAAIESAAAGLTRPGRTPARTVAIRSTVMDEPPLVLDVVPLPLQRCEFTFSARALIIVRNSRNGHHRRAAVLQAIYGLTTAEVEVALLLADGRSPESIAALRVVAVATVRNQIKSIYAKTNVTRQGELVARIGQL